MPLNNKPRILFVNEFSQLATGFGTYGNEIMKRLRDTGKYVLAEQASYCSPEDPRIYDVEWDVFPTMPAKNDQDGWNRYNNVRTAQFGELAFTNSLLNYKPDIVVAWSDPWMCSYIHRHPYRPYYKFAWMATIDGEPQKPDWIDEYKATDYLLTYSEWAANLVKRDGVNVYGTHQPGSDEKIFCPPLNKAKAKEDAGLNPDWNIIQTVMRNQPRKLYPELFKAFSRFLEICKDNGQNELAAKTFLHIHTSLRDVGWDLGEEIRKYHISHKVLFTYVDQQTNEAYLSFFKGEPAWSRFSNGKNAISSNTGKGITREQLAKIMQAADLYIQLSICEGFGIPLIDAKACGVPTMGLPYSATAELIVEPGGIPLKISGYRQESVMETQQRRAEPDNEYTARKIHDFFTATPNYRKQLGEDARKIVLEKYTWDKCAKKWENLLDSIPITPHGQTWDSAPNIFEPDLTKVPRGLSDEQFIMWAYQYVVGRPWLLRYDTLMHYIERFTIGFNNKPFTRNDFIKECIDLCNSINGAEHLRHNFMKKIKTNTRVSLV